MGSLLLCAAAGDVLYNTAASYSLVLEVTDQNNLRDTALVVINIIETNDAATWVGAFTPSDDVSPTTDIYGTTTPLLSVSEDAPVGTIFGRVLANDANRGAVWGARIYALVPSRDTQFFAINASSGELRVGSAGAAVWDQSTFFLVVTVQDADPIAPLVVPYNVTVQLLQVNTVSIAGFAVPAGTSALHAVNASSVPPLYAGLVIPPSVDALVTTRGFGNLLVFGTGFGRTAARLAREGVALTPAGIALATPVTASFGLWSTPVSARANATCVVVVPNTVLSCAVPPGIGANLTLSVSIQGWHAVSSRALSYMPPSIIAVSKLGSGPLATEGSDALIVTGDNFGPLSTAPVLSYGPNATMLPLLYAPPACSVTTEHSALVCPTLPGVGRGLTFSVNVAGQSSAPGVFFPAPDVQYRTPTITSVVARLLQTAGGEAAAIVLSGELRPFCNVMRRFRVYLVPLCINSGTGFGPVILPDGKAADIFVQYCANFTAADAVAERLTGAPMYTSSLAASAYPAGVAPIYTARGCTVDAITPQSLLRCTSSAGVGANLDVRVTIAGQTSAVFPSAISYIAPTLTAISGIGADLCPTEGGAVVILIGSQFGPLTPLDGAGNALAGSALQPLAWYGPNGTQRYSGVQCYVRVANTEISCLTAPGTGLGHLWSVSVGGQVSPVMTTRPTSYHPPIVALEGGPGAVSAETFGGQAVVIEGRNFGPTGTAVERAVYTSGGNASVVFSAINCTLTQPHVQVRDWREGGGGAERRSRDAS